MTKLQLLSNFASNVYILKTIKTKKGGGKEGKRRRKREGEAKG